MDNKEFTERVTFRDGSNGSENVDTVVGEKKGTVSDVEDMKRLGKEQLFRVRSSPCESRRITADHDNSETSIF
jgi:hypothetical protein